jgi:hypothetical protein
MEKKTEKSYKKDVIKGALDKNDDGKLLPIAFEPKVSFRYIVKMERFPSWLISSADRPKCYLDKYGVNWEPITMELFDPIVPSTTQQIFGMISKLDINLGNITINMLGPAGDVVEEWVLYDCKILSVDFGNLSWSNHSMDLRIKLKIGFRNAELEF